ncbi:hypothetical protein EVAR_67208_1 [Eumeta japonica]|uniref:Uncharacterized protein n=1 Tax=Eumeta variegata TaxID=151549 RepID=A0A4C2A599_EUMVA|nr:hypothetical protein EVAR_67208_1 [Eumeta japonica]
MEEPKDGKWISSTTTNNYYFDFDSLDRFQNFYRREKPSLFIHYQQVTRLEQEVEKKRLELINRKATDDWQQQCPKTGSISTKNGDWNRKYDQLETAADIGIALHYSPGSCKTSVLSSPVKHDISIYSFIRPLGTTDSDGNFAKLHLNLKAVLDVFPVSVVDADSTSPSVLRLKNNNFPNGTRDSNTFDVYLQKMQMQLSRMAVVLWLDLLMCYSERAISSKPDKGAHDDKGEERRRKAVLNRKNRQ